MFDLGFRDVIVNSDKSGTIAGNSIATSDINIPGALKAAGISDISAVDYVAPVAATLGRIVITVPAFTANSVVTYKLRIQHNDDVRMLPDIFPEGDTQIFNVKTGTVANTNAANLAAAINEFVDVADLEMQAHYTATAATNKVTVTFIAGFEGFSFDKITATEVISGNATVLNPIENSLTAVLTPGTVGVGLGSQLESNVKNATNSNNDPYGVRFGGSDMVDIRAMYGQLIVKVITQNGMEPHASSGYGLNADSIKLPRTYVIWINTTSASTMNTAAIALG